MPFHCPPYIIVTVCPIIVLHRPWLLYALSLPSTDYGYCMLSHCHPQIMATMSYHCSPHIIATACPVITLHRPWLLNALALPSTDYGHHMPYHGYCMPLTLPSTHHGYSMSTVYIPTSNWGLLLPVWEPGDKGETWRLTRWILAFLTTQLANLV